MMRTSKRLALLGLAALLLSAGAGAGLESRVETMLRSGRTAEWMRNVVLLPTEQAPGESAAPTPIESAPPPETAPPAAAAEPEPLRAPASERELPVWNRTEPSGEDIRETTIHGGMGLRNETGYSFDAGDLLRAGPTVRLPAEGSQILIIHTHGSEAYTQAGLDRYEPNDRNRTEDRDFNVIRVGDELTKLFEEAGLRVLHDREIYDFPSYTGSYDRSGAAIAACLRENPDIAVVLDLHRDALGSDGVVYKTMAEEERVVASQIMLLVGTDESGLEHPRWRENLALALYLQEAVGRLHPTLMRPVAVVPQRYNQHLTQGSLILEVGSSGNTLQEALAAVRLFAEAAGPALLALTEDAPEE